MKLLQLLIFVGMISNAFSIIKGINMFGWETEHKDLMCNWVHPDYNWHLNKVQELGFNTIRLPFCYQYVADGDWSKMDAFFEVIKNYNLHVVLDFHRLYNTHQSPKPYDENITIENFLLAWETILSRYQDNDKLVGVDIFNEYQSNDFNEWNQLARRITDYIESKFPQRFWYLIGCVVWNSNCQFVQIHGVPYGDRVHLGMHQYCFSNTEPFETHWTQIFGTEKVIIGEYGAMSEKPEQMAWLRRFILYLKKHHYYDSFFWSWSWNSGDTGGILKKDCTEIEQSKMDLLWYYWTDRRYLRNST
jgi:endoglucanase